MALLEDLTNRAKVTYPRILLPESNDARVLEAASLLSRKKIVKIVLLDAQKLIQLMALNSLTLKMKI